MAQQPNVPQFGNWEGGGDVPYTQYFDKARKGRNVGKPNNPSDPQQNPNAFPDGASPPHAPLRNASEQEILKHIGERQTSKEDNYQPRHKDLPAHSVAAAQKPVMDASDQQHGEWVNTKDQRTSSRGSGGGSERSFDHSPLHPHHQAKPSGKGGFYPGRERKSSTDSGHGFAPSPIAEGRHRSRMVDTADQIADKGSTVPKFGDWDEKDPASADGYTNIFNKVREEKQVGSGKVPMINTEPPVFYGDPRREDENSGCSCFGWCKRR